MKTAIKMLLLMVMLNLVSNCHFACSPTSDKGEVCIIEENLTPVATDTLEQGDYNPIDSVAVQNNEVKQSTDEVIIEYYDSEDYKALKRVMAVEPDGSLYYPIEYFWYDINYDGKKELWVLNDYIDHEKHLLGYTLFAYEVDKKRHLITEMGKADIPRYSSIHKGKGYLFADYRRMGYQVWYKISWKKGVKIDCIYESDDYGGREDHTYLEPKEPELKMNEIKRGFDELVMTQVFGIWDEDY